MSKRSPESSNSSASGKGLDRRTWCLLLGTNVVTGTVVHLLSRESGREEQNAARKTDDDDDTRAESTEQKLTRANELLRSLPGNLHGASIEKNEVPGAQAIVVHVAQVHNVKPLGENPEHEKCVQKVQEEIEVLLEALTQHCATRGVSGWSDRGSCSSNRTQSERS